MTKLFNNDVASKHQWVTVVNPINHRALLQACDSCGVVKSENTIVRSCKTLPRLGLISNAIEASARAC